MLWSNFTDGFMAPPPLVKHPPGTIKLIAPPDV
jgi:hypothetical protein